MSTEASGRAMHPMSPARLEALESARYFYDLALRSLPASEPTPSFPGSLDEDHLSLIKSCPESSASDTSSVHNLDISNSGRSGYSASSFGSEHPYISDTEFPKPPYATTASHDESFEHFADYEKLSQSSILEQSSGTLGDCENSLVTPYQGGQQSLARADPWLSSRSVMLYNNYLEEFAGLLIKQVSSMDSLVSANRELQTSRYAAKRVYSYGDDEEAKAADLRDRIRRLKASGWSRERFDPSRYELLCEEALADLYQ